MPVMDEFREEREAIRHAPFAKKWEYFKDYYLLRTIIILFVAGILGSLLYTYISRKNTALYVVLVNFALQQESADELVMPFAGENINTRKEAIIIDNSSYISADANEINFLKYGYEDEQRLFSMVMTGDIDLLISGEDILKRYAQQEWFDDLSGVLDAEQLRSLEAAGALLYWNDRPIAVRVPTSSKLLTCYVYNGEQGKDIYAGFPAGSLHRELASSFLDYLRE